MFKQIHRYFLGDLDARTDSLHEITQTKLLCNIAVVVFAAGVLVTIISVALGTYPVLVPAAGNVALAIVMLIILKQGNVKLAGGIYFTTLFFLLFGNLIMNDQVMHFGSPFWIMLLNVMVMYILGFRWGIGFIIASTIGFSYYVIEVLPHSLAIADELPNKIHYTVVYETVIVLFLLGYVIGSILKASRDSDAILKAKNEALEIRNEEKEVMLKEIHHRVKNNLQVVISLMRLKVHELTDQETKDHYQETINRVMAMAKIHERIYQSSELNNIDLEHYFKDLSQTLLHSYETDKKVDFVYNITVDRMELEQSVPLALIFNELFSNSLEHAFANTDDPKIQLDLYVDENGLSFQYRDNGTWKEVGERKSFGLELIDALVGQLDGKLIFEKEPTTFWVIIDTSTPPSSLTDKE